MREKMQQMAHTPNNPHDVQEIEMMAQRCGMRLNRQEIDAILAKLKGVHTGFNFNDLTGLFAGLVGGGHNQQPQHQAQPQQQQMRQQQPQQQAMGGQQQRQGQPQQGGQQNFQGGQGGPRR